MYSNEVYTDINEALPYLFRDLLDASEVGSRAGKTRELTHVGITLTEPLSREILVPGRKANLAAQIAETAWVLAGRNDVEWLANYLPRAADFSDDGETWRSGYGPRLRAWRTHFENEAGEVNGTFDQLAYIVDALRTNPETRQAVAQLWDPAVDPEEGPFKDRSCNNWLHFLARGGKLDLHVAIRSNDLMWGWSGINAFEWSVLLEVVAGLTGLGVGALHFSITSLHLYERHWEKAHRIVEEAAATERVTAESSPRFKADPVLDMAWLDDTLARWFQIEYDIRTGSPLVRGYIDSFPEPMLRSWLHVLDWWWNGIARVPGLGIPIQGTALAVAASMGVKPPWAQRIEEKNIDFGAAIATTYSEADLNPVSPFLQHAIALHNEKHAAYGDSWKRRGEMLGIMANIARKIDRLGGSETSDETSADTALDLMVYLAKYRTWLDQRGESDDPSFANDLLVQTEKVEGFHIVLGDGKSLEDELRANFDLLEKQVMVAEPLRWQRVDQMLRDAYLLARYRFEQLDSDSYRGADHE